MTGTGERRGSLTTLLAAFTLIFLNETGPRTMDQAREPIQIVHLQAGLGTSAGRILSEIDLSVAQKIGRQLAQIGDKVNRHYHDNLPNPWLLPFHAAAHAHRLARNRLYRGILGPHRRLRARPGEMWVWLSSPLRSQVIRAECRGAWVKTTYITTLLPNQISVGLAHPYSWAAGLLTALILAAAVVWIGF
ncbi:hypothetical protein AAFF_G00162130 [Aldrovandia affinis]|uniref:Uncharacterized protein n=1 Tax=Aldrovandia affinis TaxID=143900 RepID=A0AAD7RQ90_9TELE|nr:hypothetical protein AAFF_G00162130 [Aldrovandia affinis]